MTSGTRDQDQRSGFSRLVRTLKLLRVPLRARVAVAPGIEPHVPVPPAPRRRSGALRDNERVAALQESLALRFADETLVREALTHRSYLNEIDQAWPSNERLEFLGDAVLGLISTDYLFHQFPDVGEGELTNLRSALVRTETLARFAAEIQLGRYLFLGRGEEISRGRERPAGLACAFEALLGALYSDAGYDRARDFALRFLEPELQQVLVGRLHRNAKSMLQELVQGRLQQTPTYQLVEESGPDHAKSFTVEVRVGDRVLASGHDRSKRGAEQVAAEIALTTLAAEWEPAGL